MRSLVIGALMSAAVLLAAPPAALAAEPPTILSAGIDARDQLHATWAVAPGTTFHHVSFATDPAPDPDVPAYFAFDNFATFSSAMSNPTGTGDDLVHRDLPRRPRTPVLREGRGGR